MRLLDIRLDGSPTGTIKKAVDRGCVSPQSAARFLATNSAAKIVVVVDTHSLEETGSFVWKGSDEDPLDFQVCLLPRVSARASRMPQSRLTHR